MPRSSSRPPRPGLVRALVTSSITLINLFFKIKSAKVNRVLEWRLTDDEDDTSNLRPRVLVSAKSGLPSIGRQVRVYHLLSHLYNWYLLVKNFTLVLIKEPEMAAYRYLDCYLLGRFIINGRAIEVAPHCACYASLMRLIWHYSMMRRTPEFRAPCVEFLLDHAGHEFYWARAEARERERGRRRAWSPDGTGSELNWSSRLDGRVSLLLEYGNPLQDEEEEEEDEQQRGEYFSNYSKRRAHTPPAAIYKLRPNRTREAWRSLAELTQTLHTIYLGIFAFLCLLFYRMGLPVVFTQHSFEFTYRHCLAWVAGERARGAQSHAPQQHHQNDSNTMMLAQPASQWPYSMVMGAALEARSELSPEPSRETYARLARELARPEPIGEFLLPFKGFVRLSLFHAVRGLLDVLDSFALYWELAFSYNSNCFMSFVMSKDIIYYADSINARLELLVVRMRHGGSSSCGSSRPAVVPRPPQLPPPPPPPAHFELAYDHFRSMRPSRPDPRGRQPGERGRAAGAALAAEISDIQAQIADLFTLIDSYNKYISLQSMCLIVAWLGYSALVSSWIFLPGTENPKTEWYVAHVGATLYVFLMLWSMSDVKASCRRLYKLITIAMALDADQRERDSKLVWVSLLKFYSPRPLYCFALIGNIEITYLLGLKLCMWLLSALIVASSFFQVYNIK